MSPAALGPAPVTAPLRPLEALDRAVYLLDRMLAPGMKIRAFRTAAATVREVGEDEVAALARAGRVQTLPGIGASTGGVITEAVEGRVPAYVARLEAESVVGCSAAAEPYRAALRGDTHLHSDWSDGGAPIEAMARTAIAIGHEWMVLTDHSPRLTIAHGLDRERLVAQLDAVAALNAELAPFRILTGLEVDILEDGGLDLDDDLLERLDVVVASVHSKLRMDREAMTRRLLLAASSPHVDILGHVTGRKLSSDGEQPASDAVAKRPPSVFDAELVFAACAAYGTAVEINCRPERQDPPDDLLDTALGLGCHVTIGTDAHAPGQLEWQAYGCEKAAAHAIDPGRILATFGADDLLAWVDA